MYHTHARTICRACNVTSRLSHRSSSYAHWSDLKIWQPCHRSISVDLRSRKHSTISATQDSRRENGGRNTLQSSRHDFDGDSASQDTDTAILGKETGLSSKDVTVGEQAEAEGTSQAETAGNARDAMLHTEGEPIARMRMAGASITQVVREARNLFGESLPRDILNNQEVAFYRRLYGEPAYEIDDDLDRSGGYKYLDSQNISSNTLYSAEGNEIVYQSDGGSSSKGFNLSQDKRDNTLPDALRDRSIYKKPSVAESLTMQDIADSVDGVIFHNELDAFEDDIEEEEDNDTVRGHPLTRLGKFSTNPRTIFLPREEYLRPVERVMSDFSNKHLKEVCERAFGGAGLPDSPLTPRSGRFKQQVPIPLEANQHIMSEMEANAFITSIMPPTYASIMSVLVETRKRLGSSWLTNLLAREGGPRVLDVSAGGAGIIAWREVVKAHWAAIHSSDRRPPPPPASKSVVVTGSDTLRHRAATMLENTTFIPRLPDYVHTRDTPTLEDDRPAQQRKQFDVIIAPHSLFGLKEEWMRKQHVQNLWSLLAADGGVLILIEKGMPRGFEAIAGAREMLLERHIAVPAGHKTRYSSVSEDETIHRRETGMIVAPCTTHEKCPMYSISGPARGRRDVCSFQQRYIRPGYLQRILGAKDRNHDDVDFSYISVMKGDDLRSRDLRAWEDLTDPVAAPLHPEPAEMSEQSSTWLENVQMGFETITPETVGSRSDTTAAPDLDDVIRPQLPALHNLPRIVYPPIKRKGHVTLDLCTPAGSIERWTIPRSFSRQAYRDARKSQWGDLWALGAKTRAMRNLKLGTSDKDIQSKNRNGLSGSNKGRSRTERLRIKAEEILEAAQQEKLDEAAEAQEIMKELDEEFEIDASIPFDPEEQEKSQDGLLPKPKNEYSEQGSKSRAKKKASTMHNEAGLSDSEVSHVISEWQDDFDRFESPGTKKKLNKVEKQKIKKALRKSGNRVHIER